MPVLPAMRDDNSEIIPYNFDSYRVFIGTERTSDHTNMRMFRHWHDELELVIPITGEIVYCVNGDEMLLKPGSGCLINSRQIHYGYSQNGEDCEFIYCLFHPMLLCATSNIEKQFVQPVINNDSLAYIQLSQSLIWHNNIIVTVQEMFSSLHSRSPELHLQSGVYKIWSLVYDHAYRQNREQHILSGYRLSALRDMLSYIESNFGEKIYLETIAKAGNVSKSCCNMIFNTYMKESPVLYLLNYRLAKSCELLINTEQSVTDIALSVGFNNLSYYINKFREKYDCTPIQYRRLHQKVKSAK